MVSGWTRAIFTQWKEREDASLSACCNTRHINQPKAPLPFGLRRKMAICSVASPADTQVTAAQCSSNVAIFDPILLQTITDNTL
jgi:hypothetical protein